MRTEKPYVLISGATSDIGASIAQLLSENYSLLLHGRSEEKLKALQKKLSPNCTTELWMADLTKVSMLKPSLKALLEERQIKISGFVHCAGTHKILPFKNFRDDYSREIFDVNFFSAVEIIQTLLLKKNEGTLSRIIFISALYSKRGNKGNTMYAASKGAIDSLVKSLAIELAPDVNVNSILPGAIRTQMTADIYDDPKKRALIDSRYPIGHGQCSDIAMMVEYLMGCGGRWITAQNYHVDGGASML